MQVLDRLPEAQVMLLIPRDSGQNGVFDGGPRLADCRGDKIIARDVFFYKRRSVVVCIVWVGKLAEDTLDVIV